jgi:hypothetical protein
MRIEPPAGQGDLSAVLSKAGRAQCEHQVRLTAMWIQQRQYRAETGSRVARLYVRLARQAALLLGNPATQENERSGLHG